MGLIREPLNVDFYVIDKPYTKAEREAITKFIQNDKKKGRLAAKRARIRKKNKKTKETA